MLAETKDLIVVDTPGTFLSTTSVDCGAPPLTAATAAFVYHLSVSLNAFDFTPMPQGSDVYTAYGVEQVAPLALARQAGGAIDITGYNFPEPSLGTSETRCRIGGGVTVATWVSRTTLRCPLPDIEVTSSAGEQLVSVEVAANGRDYTNDGMNITLFDPPTITAGAVKPSTGTVDGGEIIAVRGENFVSGPVFQYMCRFVSQVDPSDHSEVDAYYISPEEVKCITPHNPSMQTTAMYVEVSLNGKQYTQARAATFEYGATKKQTGGGLSNGALAGLVVVIVLVVALCGAFWWWESKGRTQWNHAKMPEYSGRMSEMPVHRDNDLSAGHVRSPVFGRAQHHALEMGHQHHQRVDGGPMSFEDD